MPPLDVKFFVTALLFGALMGFGLGRNGDDRTATLVTCLLTAAVGAVAWVVSDQATMPEVAGSSMTVGGISALAVLALTGRRANPSS